MCFPGRFSVDKSTIVGEGEGGSVWEAGEVYMAGEEADPQPEGQRQRWESIAGM